MTIRDQFAEIGTGTELLRTVRYMRDDDLNTCTVEQLEHAARWLRAASYSALEGARRIDRHLTTREPSCSHSDPNTTAPSTNTDAPPTAAPPSTDPGSPSKPTPTASSSSA